MSASHSDISGLKLALEALGEWPVTGLAAGKLKLTQLLEEANAAPAPLLTMKTAFGDLRACTWTHNEDTDAWKTQCGKTWHFGNDGPEENGMHFCHACGGVLTVAGSTNEAG